MRWTYIAGGMTGYPEFNFPAFHRMEEIIRTIWGGRVLNPARHFWGITGLPWIVYITYDLLLVIFLATDLVMLQGWENSKGARWEYAVAKFFGKRIWNHYLERLE